MHRLIAAVLKILKWPIAGLFAVYLPASIWGLGVEVMRDGQGAATFSPLALGFVGYLVLWWAWLGRSMKFLATLEHELTHAFFALVTGNRIVELHVTADDGALLYTGSKNFLIASGPYWFPSLTWVALLATAFVDRSHLFGLRVVIGASLAFHVISSWQETHSGQTDLRDDTGLLFAVSFLPTANVLSVGLVLADVRAHLHGVVQFIHSVVNAPWNPFRIWHWL